MLASSVVKIFNVYKVDVTILICSAVSSSWYKSVQDFLPEKGGSDSQIVLIIFLLFSIEVTESLLYVTYPGMVEHLGHANPTLRLQNEHSLDEVLHFLAYGINREFKLSLQDNLMQVSDVAGFEGNGSLDHGV